MRHRIFGAFLLGALAAAAGCDGNGAGPPGNGGGTAPPPPQPGTIEMRDNFFNPAVDTVTAGTQVTWRNEAIQQHNTTSDSPLWESPNLNSGGTFSFTFDEPGEFPYHCTFHGSPGAGMAGRVVVIE